MKIVKDASKILKTDICSDNKYLEEKHKGELVKTK